MYVGAFWKTFASGGGDFTGGRWMWLVFPGVSNLPLSTIFFPQTVYCWGSILGKKSWPHSLAAPNLWPGSVSGSCPPLVLVLALSRSCPPLVLLLSFFCPPPSLGRAHELCGLALWPGSVSGSCPSLVLWPRCPALDTLTGRAPELCGRAL